MGNKLTIKKIGFEDIQYVLKHKKNQYALINTLDITDQTCLIPGTVSVKDEEFMINKHLNKNISIVIYGKNANDVSIFKKYEQLLTLGFTSVYVYTGGLFEWLLLQDIYGNDEFPTTSYELDILKYRTEPVLQSSLSLENID
uniref:Rhodanese domain-containing protein n=1 Tax=viral metagenome TaxID=1070528 RepID=A0A6C0C5W1_9ZZZZ